MNKKLIFSTILFIIALGLSVFLLVNNKSDDSKGSPPVDNSQIVLFYGEGCPHCAIVEKYVSENNVKEKISFEKKEVYYNRNNSQELVEKAKKCGIPTDAIGVPLLWDGSKCYVGDSDIVEFFKQKIHEK